MSEAHPQRPQPDQQPDQKNERAFAIEVEQDEIWRLLLEEVRLGVESGRAQIVHQEAPRALLLDIRLGWGLAVRYDYRLSPLPRHAGDLPQTEAAVTVVPYGIRHALANIITFGRAITPYMLAVTQGLSNLKAAAEPRPPATST